MERILVSACLLGVGCRYDCKDNGNEKILALLQREDIQLIPVCPEQLGGLPTPRLPSERVGERVINSSGQDVTAQFENGAAETLKLAKRCGCLKAILKARSPSCGYGQIYDGSFTGTLIEGNGVTAELLLRSGITVQAERDL